MAIVSTFASEWRHGGYLVPTCRTDRQYWYIPTQSLCLYVLRAESVGLRFVAGRELSARLKQPSQGIAQFHSQKNEEVVEILKRRGYSVRSHRHSY